jgi:hypothetical protein
VGVLVCKERRGTIMVTSPLQPFVWYVNAYVLLII